MTDKILHVIQFVEQEEYEHEEYPEYVYTATGHVTLPEPNEGDIVSFGWHTEDGERVDRVDMQDASRSTSDVGYERSVAYEIVGVERHYHHSRQTGQDGRLVTNRNEITTTVLMTEVDT